MWWLIFACSPGPSPSVSMPIEVEENTDAAAAARRALLEGRHEEALKGFKTVVSGDSDVGLAVQQAHALRIAGKTEEARLAYLSIAQRFPDHVMAHLVLGELARTEGRWAAALPHLDRASELAPNSPVPWEHRAVCLWELGRKAEARKALDRAEALGSTQVGVLRGGMQ